MKKSVKVLLGVTMLATMGGFLGANNTALAPFATVKRENAKYSITNGTYEDCTFAGCPSAAEAGDVIAFTVKLTPGRYFNDTVIVSKTDGTLVDVTRNGKNYSFTMPEDNVTVKAECGMTDYTIAKDEHIGTILDENDKAVKSATFGSTLHFKATESIDYTVTHYYLDGVELTGVDGTYTFIMPFHPITLTCDYVNTAYTLTGSTELDGVSVGFYSDADATTEITEAIKGDKVYVHMSSANALWKYSIAIADANGNAIEATAGDEWSTFSFDMVSSNITVTVTGEDWSLYGETDLVNKGWKWANWYSYGSAKEYTNVAFSDTTNLPADQTASFTGNGAYSLDSSSTWSQYSGTFELDDKTDPTGHGIMNYATSYSSYQRPFYYTPTMWVTPYSVSGTTFGDVNIGVCDDADLNFNAHIFSSSDKYYFSADANGDIVDTIFILDSTVYLDTVAKDSDGNVLTTASSISSTSSYEVYTDNGQYLASITSGAISNRAYAFNVPASDIYDVTFTDAEGNEIIAAKAGTEVTVTLALKDGVSTDFEFSSVSASYGSSYSPTTVTLTPVEGKDNTYTFTVPSSAVTFKIVCENPNQYAGRNFVGTFKGYNIYSSTTSSVSDLSSKSLSTWTITAGGLVNTAHVTDGSITSVDDGEYGTINTSYTRYSTNYTYSNTLFGGNLLYEPYSSDMFDFYLCVKIGDTETASEFSNKIAYSNSNYWAISFYHNTDLVGSAFCDGTSVYMGVTFTFNDSSTDVSTSTDYTVSRDGADLFTVVNGTVTAVTTTD